MELLKKRLTIFIKVTIFVKFLWKMYGKKHNHSISDLQQETKEATDVWRDLLPKAVIETWEAWHALSYLIPKLLDTPKTHKKNIRKTESEINNTLIV